jgi:biotin carboxylase
MYSITEVDAIVEKCKQEKVDAVLSFCIDPAQKPYQQICEKLGVPCYATKEQFDIFTDKRKFKDFCIKNNVDAIPDYSEEDILNDVAEYPLFIKPSICRGSRGQSICYTKEEALEGLRIAKELSADGKSICEKYMGGKQDIASAFFVVDGEPYLVKFGDRYLGNSEDGLDKQVMCTKFPSDFTPIFEKEALQRVKDMIKSLGIKFGPVFLQGFADGNSIRYYDPALRMPGGDYDLVLKKATGFDTVKSLIHFALTGDTKTCFGDPQECFKLNGGIGMIICYSVRPGHIAKVEGLDKLLSEPSVVYGRQIVPEGEDIPASGDIRQRVAAVGAFVKNKYEAETFVKKMYDIYHVYDENGNDMIVSKYDYKA